MKIRVGILQCSKIEFSLGGRFTTTSGEVAEGDFIAEYAAGKILFGGRYYDSLRFEAGEGSLFELKNVVIGKEFHWQQCRNERFEGDLVIITDGEELVAINEIDLERYIYSVIASEMSATSFVELLKAHAVISRSWVLSAIGSATPSSAATFYTDRSDTDDPVYIRWYERDAHRLFDVCADDHCQRYQGIPSQEPPALREAIDSTAGEVLVYDGKICDARFSKCCGGYTERFSSCWAEVDYPYLTVLPDSDGSCLQPITDEATARSFVLSSPDAFCNTADSNIIRQVFNDYDRSTKSFFRWKVTYSVDKISEIVASRSGIDFGSILDLVPVQRTASGRIVRLRIVGTRHTATIGKELEIRRWLSRTHLYSSAFVVDRDDCGRFVICGAGWGHGVGLCQIGAAVMAHKGYSYQSILRHYYPHTVVGNIKGGLLVSE
ncbi:MAG: SpoIID/LytB domain-containing protein [Bacteroidetes bacterium]|nr:MAG: SpoIID/LytB domain-containing protein [Bacteroidota bacterium]